MSNQPVLSRLATKAILALDDPADLGLLGLLLVGCLAPQENLYTPLLELDQQTFVLGGQLNIGQLDVVYRLE